MYETHYIGGPKSGEIFAHAEAPDKVLVFRPKYDIWNNNLPGAPQHVIYNVLTYRRTYLIEEGPNKEIGVAIYSYDPTLDRDTDDPAEIYGGHVSNL